MSEEESWTNLIIGDRMVVDEQFSDRILESDFTQQDWNMIMTAVEFKIEKPGKPDKARIVADTTKVGQIVPELDKIHAEMNAMAAGRSRESGGGFISSIKETLGIGSKKEETDQKKIEAADRLAQEYAKELQAHLESRGKWEEIREAAEK